ncbi:hypothetical protein [Francisella sp. SYW-2]|uniref:hypothetical protein n=1 Tax=Francisella sp. SYW-2 TaxID=2610886 RepID=UPI00123DA23B|nr:hypothetical protein [Francisella sp. SYW-2]
MENEKNILEKIKKYEEKLEQAKKENALKIYEYLSKHHINIWNIKSIKKAFAYLEELGEDEFK